MRIYIYIVWNAKYQTHKSLREVLVNWADCVGSSGLLLLFTVNCFS